MVPFGTGDNGRLPALARAKSFGQVYRDRHGVSLDFDLNVLHGDPPFRKIWTQGGLVNALDLYHAVTP